MNKYAGDHETRFGDAYAIRETLATTGRALLVTSIVLCGSFLIFLGGYMTVMNDLGRIATLSITVAFLAGVIIVPALIGAMPGLFERPAERSAPFSPDPLSRRARSSS
ncbi:MAG: hypothetical protein CL933_10995 [Deltaproteobacteria bacterium]|nr:hypothetical protein [Deltaproteobacteria bacterium]